MGQVPTSCCLQFIAAVLPRSSEAASLATGSGAADARKPLKRTALAAPAVAAVEKSSPDEEVLTPPSSVPPPSSAPPPAAAATAATVAAAAAAAATGGVEPDGLPLPQELSGPSPSSPSSARPTCAFGADVAASQAARAVEGDLESALAAWPEPPLESAAADTADRADTADQADGEELGSSPVHEVPVFGAPSVDSLGSCRAAPLSVSVRSVEARSRAQTETWSVQATSRSSRLLTPGAAALADWAAGRPLPAVESPQARRLFAVGSGQLTAHEPQLVDSDPVRQLSRLSASSSADRTTAASASRVSALDTIDCVVGEEASLDAPLATPRRDVTPAPAGAEGSANAARQTLAADELEDLSETCPCGNLYMPDSIYCRKCGRRRGEACTAASSSSAAAVPNHSDERRPSWPPEDVEFDLVRLCAAFRNLEHVAGVESAPTPPLQEFDLEPRPEEEVCFPPALMLQGASRPNSASQPTSPGPEEGGNLPILLHPSSTTSASSSRGKVRDSARDSQNSDAWFKRALVGSSAPGSRAGSGCVTPVGGDTCGGDILPATTEVADVAVPCTSRETSEVQPWMSMTSMPSTDPMIERMAADAVSAASNCGSPERNAEDGDAEPFRLQLQLGGDDLGTLMFCCENIEAALERMDST
mmetsp:Transcript_28942/g.96404  ORF Transcript_28942/g.96404 Transcript_28942/m.96404 type:complete len:648 (+) Transcript_28942:103-2046(+)